MGKLSGKQQKRSKDIPSFGEVKDALAQASDKDLLNEAFRRGLIADMPEMPAPDSRSEAETYRDNRFREMLQRRMWQERLQEIRQRKKEARQGRRTLEEDVESERAAAARHREYVEQLFDLLHQKRLEKMQEQCIWRTDSTSEFAHLGILVTRTIFDHLVIARRDKLDAGICNIESVWEYLMSTDGYKFASDLVEADINMPPNVWLSFIYDVIRGAARSFLRIAEEGGEEPADQSNGNGCQKIDFIN